MRRKKFNLFIYGSLRDRAVFKSVSGLDFTRKFSRADDKNLFAELALLDHYRKVSPDNVYFYAVPNPSSRIEGLLIHNLPAEAMAEIDRYEGKRYEREKVLISTATGTVRAEAYLVSHESMQKHFGDRFHVNLIHELWLRKRIDKFIKRRIRPGERTADAEAERKAGRELLATTERDLVISHYRSDAVSDYYLEHELDRPRPGIKHLYTDPNAEPFIKNYLALVIRQVLFNQLDDRIQRRYRFELEHMRTSERYFKRSVSMLIALRMINLNRAVVDLIVQEALDSMPYQKHDLFDYVKYAVRAAGSLFDTRVAQSHLNRIRANFQPGLIPLGAELELSNLGPNAITMGKNPKTSAEPVYDGFRYFTDFQLDVLCWKLGGYIDDHTGSTDIARRVGFLELAPGRLNIAGELSRPATADPWLLNQLIREIALFYDVRPHSLHLSFQLLKNQIGKQNVLPLGFVKSLLILGGGLQQKDTGRLWISRMGYDEITQRDFGEELVFARASRRRWYLGGDEIADRVPKQATAHIQQYKFIRLDRRANYEPLIMCLKGLQIAYNPADYLSADQLKSSKKLQQQYEELKQWAAEPRVISPQTISRFVKTIRDGLMTERHGRPVHKLHYIDWVVNAIDVQLRMFNQQLKKTKT
jgi:gamma-glutamylcyclotransferase (GGCT)/AIG2-like uncharacterized protein YtfP